MDKGQEKAFYDRIGLLSGWDFSRLKVQSEGVEWDFYKEVGARSTPSAIALDIGTGGGELALKLASFLQLLIGIDQSESMWETARSNARKSEAPNARFFLMDSEKLLFPDGFFQLISCRHAPFHAGETARVLDNGGWLLTQQVSEYDKWNIKEAFGRGQDYGYKDGTACDKYVEQLQAAGRTVTEVREYDAVEYYETDEALLFLLSHTPIVPEFGRHSSDIDKLNGFIEANRTDRGIRTNSKRYMIVAQKELR
jgi:ubiquinone/menaquinone biosynthesis C-methylase UbiE